MRRLSDTTVKINIGLIFNGIVIQLGKASKEDICLFLDLMLKVCTRSIQVLNPTRTGKFTSFLAVESPSFRAGRKLHLLFELIQSVDYEKDL